VRRGCCYHGLALNVDMDLAPFSAIDPCGYPGLAVTQTRAHGVLAGATEMAMSSPPYRPADRQMTTLEKKEGPGEDAHSDRAGSGRTARKPEWIRVRAASPGFAFHEIKQSSARTIFTRCARKPPVQYRRVLRKGHSDLHDPGDLCTRRCPFCDVAHGRPLAPDPEEPAHLAQTIAALASPTSSSRAWIATT